MTSDTPDLNKRRRARISPRPPADYGIDSVEVTPPNDPTRSTQASRSRELEEEPVVQLNTRIAFSYKRQLSNLSAERRQTIRSLVEQALEETYGQEGR
ncbi:hypothetical protein QR98_0049670 [Sarcoptes scabiei]|uniref:Uncharacterized protein n=1 Tax=Sarcoptes scabiei TaxID=52283 RepID=A0A132A7U4_SARSC|nr:hypothetical protein QR98_0049670 [Sarcoptes scabiei]